MPETYRPSVDAEPKREKRERGSNVEVKFTFFRHSQKASGNVVEEGGGLSKANLSERGRERAKDWGAQHLKDRLFNKVYATASDRTKETLQEALTGGEVEGGDVLQASDKTRAFFSLPALEASNAFMGQYVQKMNEERDQILKAEFDGKELTELTPDEQEFVMERAEEPSIAWYLSFGDQKPDQDTPSPTEQAQAVAWKMNRLVQLADRLESEKEIDLISSGHKTSTEAFLQEVLRESGVSLEEFGGSMKILDGWDFVAKTDVQGNKTIQITLRREDGGMQEVNVSEDVIKSLAHDYIERTGMKKKKADG